MSPIQEVVTRKMAGIKMKSRVFRIYGGKPPTDALSHLVSYTGSIVDSIERLPSWYSRDELVGALSSGAQELFKRDPEFAKALKQVEGETGIQDADRMSTLSEAFEVVSKRMESSYLNRREAYTSIYLDSDMPDSYFSNLDEAERMTLWRMKLITSRIRHLEGELALRQSRGFALFKQTVIAAQTELAPIIRAGKEVATTAMTLEMYATLANAENVKQVFEDIPLFKKKLDANYYSKLEQGVGSAISQLHRSCSRLFSSNHLLYLNAQELADLPISDSAKELQSSLAQTLLVSG